MSSSDDALVDWSKGIVIVHRGAIFCSPNCQRPVLIPDISQAREDPLAQTRSALPSAFQPVWWNFTYGWLSFVPLSPSFLSLPFKDLCWHPRIESTSKTTTLPSGGTKSERRFQVRSDDAMQWFDIERRLSRTAEVLRMFFHIPGALPPLPSSFGLSGLHRSVKVALRCVNECRKSFVVWMGFLSYLIAQTTRPEYRKVRTSPLPIWYQALLDKEFQRPWLDGLANSTVCSFDSHTTRSGVILPYPNNDSHQPEIEWFLRHNIPCWYHLNRHTEDHFRSDRFLQKLLPPADKIQSALTLLFDEPRMPLVAFVFKSYNFFKWGEYAVQARKLLDMTCTPSPVLDMCGLEMARQRRNPIVNSNWDDPQVREQLLNEMEIILAEREAQLREKAFTQQSFIQQGMIARDTFDGAHTTLHENWVTFFEKREAREAEHLQTESPQARQARLQRDKQRPTKKCKMYVWQKVQTSGGGYLYARTLTTQSEHSNLVGEYSSVQSKFYARTGDWDFFEEFDPAFHAKKPSEDSDEESDREDDSNKEVGSKKKESSSKKDDSSKDNDSNKDDLNKEDNSTKDDDIAENNASQSHEDTGNEDSMPVDDVGEEHVCTGPSNGVIEEQEEVPSTTSEQVIQAELNRSVTVEEDSPQSPPQSVQDGEHEDHRILERAQLQFGFVLPVGDTEFPPVELQWREVVRILGSTGRTNVPAAQQVALQNFFMALRDGKILPVDLDDLSRSNHWYLMAQVHEMPFTCVEGWYIFHAPRSPAATWYLGVENQAAVLYILRLLVMYPRRHSSFTLAWHLANTGLRFRTFNYMPTVNYRKLDDPFEPSMYRPEGYNFTIDDFRASLLQTRSLLYANQGRAALLRGGIIGRIAREYLDIDQALEGPSLEATFCHHGFCVHANERHDFWDDDLTDNEEAMICGTYMMYTGSGAQLTKVSWFPPEAAWKGSSYDSLEWTPKAEELFRQIFDNVWAGKYQPRSVSKWRDKLRDIKIPRIVYEKNRSRACTFFASK